MGDVKERGAARGIPNADTTLVLSVETADANVDTSSLSIGYAEIKRQLILAESLVKNNRHACI